MPPSTAATSPAIIFNRLLLPEPVSPMMASRWPLGWVNEIFSRATCRNSMAVKLNNQFYLILPGLTFDYVSSHIIIASGSGHALCDAAKRRRFASGDRRSRRRFFVRVEISRRGSGCKGADRGTHRRRDRAGAGSAGARDRTLRPE